MQVEKVAPDGSRHVVCLPAGAVEGAADAVLAEALAEPSAAARLEAARSGAHRAAYAALDEAAQALKRDSAGHPYPEWEIASFSQQEAAARAWQRDGDLADPEHLAMLDALRVEDPARSREDQAGLIMTKVDAARPGVAGLIVLRKATLAAIDDATDEAGVAAAMATLSAALSG